MRLDSYLVEIGDLGSRGRAKRAIAEGYVKVNGTVSSGVTVMNRNFGTTIREHSHKVQY